jgi:hypothetical protein
MILVVDDQHNLWTNMFASVCICSSQDAKVTWTKALRKQHLKRRHYEDHKSRSTSIKQSPRLEESVATRGSSGWERHIVRCHPVDQGTEAQRLVSWWQCGGESPDCLVQGWRVKTVECNTHIQQLVGHQTQHRTIRCVPSDCLVCYREQQLFFNDYI